MCFSASASFGAGIILTAIGSASLIKTKSSSQIVFASIPLIFAVQQITEGFLWLSLSNPQYEFLRGSTTYIFLFFAQVLWPVWVPWAILQLEPDEKRRRTEKILLATGGIVSAYLGYCLLTFHVEANIVGYHISYQQDYPVLGRYSGLPYLIATIVPPLVSKVRGMWLFGTAILISYIVTTVFYTDYIVSVWCFFASVISMAIFAIIYWHRNDTVAKNFVTEFFPANLKIR